MSRELRAASRSIWRFAARWVSSWMTTTGCWRSSSTTSSAPGSPPTVEAALGGPPHPRACNRSLEATAVGGAGFARYLHALDPAVQVPPSDLLSYRRRRPTPYLMSDADITAAVGGSAAPRPLRAATYPRCSGCWP